MHHVPTPDSKLPVVELTSDLPDALLRAVPCDRALQGYGKHWKGIAGGPDDYSLSEVTTHIDDFISHDWRTPRVTKYITLSYIYNRHAAIRGSLLLPPLAALLREVLARSELIDSTGDNDVHDAGVFTTLGPLVYLFLFFHWQSIRAMVKRGPLLFVDKLCIHQHDEEAKSQGILGLAAFLKKSRRLVVLWSPQYFYRLWCAYELAAWFHFKADMSSVHFVPVAVVPVILVMFLCNALLYYSWFYLWLYIPDLYLFVVTGVFSWTVGAYFFQEHVADVADLRQHLEQFAVQQTACFCCSNDHTHPQTGAPLPCDRKMVHHMIRQWTDDPKIGEEEEAALGGFNHKVRTPLRDWVTTTLPERRLFIRYQCMVNMHLPSLWLSFDVLAWRLKTDLELDVAFYGLVEALAIIFVTQPLTTALLIRLVYWSRSLVKDSTPRRILLTILVGPCISVVSTALWQAARIEAYVQFADSVIPAVAAWLVVSAFLLSLAYYTFWIDGAAASPAGVQTSPASTDSDPVAAQCSAKVERPDEPCDNSFKADAKSQTLCEEKQPREKMEAIKVEGADDTSMVQLSGGDRLLKEGGPCFCLPAPEPVATPAFSHVRGKGASLYSL
eukprot:TRINITY_DN53315_c0_g1_i1.p1 TRINITY_DN53315_c0_g1~~TRINITY_DN53315_c0_g1_i1.p1  ORF type:complete len:612 (+),score=78.81 TRINITY_DN53315_c0_g1_i1:95-1930(+)